MIAYRLNIQINDLLAGKYRVKKPIGSGSYGNVYLVEDLLHRRYALKVLRLWEVQGDLHENMVLHFQKEYEAAKQPSEYLIHTLDFGTLQGNPYFLMEYCQKGDLASVLKGKDKLALPRYARDVLMGLHILHAGGKIHRDLKPENVLIRDNDKAALTDFGAVHDKASDHSLRDWIGRPRQVWGSPLYMAPEMADRMRGGVTYLPTIDIWSFGVMLYELITDGAFPFYNITDDSDASVLPAYQENAKKGRWDSKRLECCLHGKQWSNVIGGCLNPNYQKRFQSVNEVLDELEPLLKGEEIVTLHTGERTCAIRRLTVTQGDNVGTRYPLANVLAAGRGRMVRVGRGVDNSIALPANENTYLSRQHFTLELATTGDYWTLRDGQWSKAEKKWLPSTNGTYLNATAVSEKGLRVFTGDIITAGEYKIKIE